LDEVECLAVEQHVLLLDTERVRVAASEGVVEHAAALRESAALSGDRRRVDLLHAGINASASISTSQLGSRRPETTTNDVTGRAPEKNSPCARPTPSQFSACTRRRSIALVSPAVNALRAIDEWGARTVAAGVTRADAEVDAYGPHDASLPWASVTKLLTGVAVLVAIEDGTVDLDEAAGPEGSTLRHLLAHASGLPPDDGPPLMPPGKRRIYSNAGIERAAALVAERADMSFADYF